MFAVHYLSQHSVAPRMEHLTAIKRVYQYLNGTAELGLRYQGKLLNQDLTSYSDSDWAGDPNSWRSVSGYAFIFCGAVISWLAKKQPTIALSSTEAEYMAMSHAGKEAVYLDHLYGNVVGRNLVYRVHHRFLTHFQGLHNTCSTRFIFIYTYFHLASFPACAVTLVGPVTCNLLGFICVNVKFRQYLVKECSGKVQAISV